jgi:hypothetical protein
MRSPKNNSVRTRLARETFLKRFEHVVDPDNELAPDERRHAEHAKRAHVLRLAQRAVTARKTK